MAQSLDDCSTAAEQEVFIVTEEKAWSVFGDEGLLLYQWILFTAVCQVIVHCGILTNIINIIVFVKQGFKDPVNISLLGLSISDLGCLSTLIWVNICYTPAFAAKDLPFDTMELQYLTSGIPHATFTRVTGWITAVITLERCLCIATPLKVKSIVTPQRITFLIVFIFVILIATVAPVYSVNKLGMKFYANRNKTLLGLVTTSNRERVEAISFAINNVFIPFSAFIVIIICTITLVISLRKKSKWRAKSSSTSETSNVTTRNQKVAKMVVTISTLFIASFIPLSILFIAMVSVPELSIDGKYKSLVILFGGVCIVLESINSSVNIFIYYSMSSKYRSIFSDIFCLRCNGTSVSKAT